jgi:dephospho-CoA kinase
MISRSLIEQVNAGRYLLGVTGVMGSGKTYACERLCELAVRTGVRVNHCDFDTFRRYVLDSASPYQDIRKDLITRLGNDIVVKQAVDDHASVTAARTHDQCIDREALGRIIFNSDEAMHYFKEKTYPAIRDLLSSSVANQHGLILAEWAMLIEDGLLPMVDYNLLFVTCSSAVQWKRLSCGDLPYEQLKQRIANQLSSEEKLQQAREMQKNSGKLFIFETTNSPGTMAYSKLLEQILERIL